MGSMVGDALDGGGEGISRLGGPRRERGRGRGKQAQAVAQEGQGEVDQEGQGEEGAEEEQDLHEAGCPPLLWGARSPLG